MTKCAVLYESVSGNTSAMAEAIVEGMQKVEGVEARAFSIDEVDEEYVKSCDGVVFGSPVYAGGPSAKFYTWMEHKAGKLNLAGKLGGAFATEQYIHGGASDTIVDILRHLLVYGMMVYSSGGSCGAPVIHYGPVEVSPDKEAFKELFVTYGQRFAAQTAKISR